MVCYAREIRLTDLHENPCGDTDNGKREAIGTITLQYRSGFYSSSLFQFSILTVEHHAKHETRYLHTSSATGLNKPMQHRFDKVA